MELIDSSRKISKYYDIGTKTGVNPSDDTTIGYTLQLPNVYLFNPYVYALKKSTNNDNLYIFLPRGLSTYTSITDYFNLK